MNAVRQPPLLRRTFGLVPARREGRGRSGVRSTPVAAWSFLAPALVVLTVFVLGSFVQVFYLSLTRYPVFADPPIDVEARWVGLDNYARLVRSDRFWWCLLNSLLYLLVTPALIALSLAAALVVHAGLRGSTALRLLLFLPVVTPTIVAALAWRALFHDQGLLNDALASVGLGPVGWLTQRPWTLISPMIVTLWKGFGFYMMIILAGLISVPRELEEAARMDGAGRLGIFRHVILPSIRPVLLLVLVISSISALKVFDEIYVTVQGVPIEHQTAVPLIYFTAFEAGEFGPACALGIMLFMVVLAVSLVNLRLEHRTARRAGQREAGGAS